jgi:hypothetical protein
MERACGVARLPAMHVFLDFEASSLSDDSYPIEVGWAAEDGATESHLIRPAAGWRDWDPRAEALHGLPRAHLVSAGEPHDVVARRVIEALSPHQVFVSAPSWDGKWMSVLLRAAGLPRHALRLRASAEAQYAAAAERLAGRVPQAELAARAAQVVELSRAAARAEPPRHRALPDALAELEVWRAVGALASAEAPLR